MKLRYICCLWWFQIIVGLNMIPSYPCLIYSLVSCTSDGFLLNSVLRVFLKCDFSEAYQVFVILVSKMTMKWLLMKLPIPLLIANNLKLSEILFLSVLKLRFICCTWWFQIIVDLNMIPSYPCLISSLVSCTSDGFFLNSVLWVSSSVTFLKPIRSSWFWPLRWHNEVTPDETSDTPPDR